VEICQEIMLMEAPETVYQLISEPRYLKRWFCDRARKTRDGFRFELRTSDGPNTYDAEVIETIPGERFSFRWMDSLVTTFTMSDDDFGCRLQLLETGYGTDLESLYTYEEHQAGWMWYLRRLKKLTG
jgi:uncharacterized protein YndB with AHSA1/START domain